MYEIQGGFMLTEDQLRQVMPQLPASKTRAYLPHLQATLQEFKIESVPRMAAFLAQIAHESMQFLYMKEIWGPTTAQKRYEGRKDLGNTHPGDGFRYMGRGVIQLTGRSNYRTYGQKLGIDLEGQPKRASDPDVAFRLAGQFWVDHGLNALADSGDFVLITRRINGGTNGLLDRQQFYARAKLVLAKAQAAEVQVSVHGKVIKAQTFLRDHRLFVALKPLAAAAGMRVLEAAAGRAVIQDAARQNHQFVLINQDGVGFVAFNDLPGITRWDAKTGKASWDSEGPATQNTRDLDANSRGLEPEAVSERGLESGVASERGFGNPLLDTLFDMAFSFLGDWFGKNIPLEALSVVRPALVNLVNALQTGSVRIDADLRLLMQAELDSALRRAGLVGQSGGHA
jgi:putative chitinase